MVSKLSVYLFCILLCVSCNSTQNKSQEESENITEQAVEKKSRAIEVSVENMVLFEGGKITIGQNNGSPLEAPSFEVNISPFYLDKNLVTVAQFRKFVNETGYKTDAEKFGDSGVFNFELQKWELLKGAYWEYPLGPNKEKAIDNHPVTHVSWNDANTYSEWLGKRLPYEIEWEYAAKNGGKNKNKYAWGESLKIDEKYKANVWQGSQTQVQGEDGFVFTSPVGYYGETNAGLSDMGGNVWQWCKDVFNLYSGNNQPYNPNPEIKVIRGGSFFYDEAGENSYTTTFRAQNSKETSLFNMGFRCAKDAG